MGCCPGKNTPALTHTAHSVQSTAQHGKEQTCSCAPITIAAAAATPLGLLGNYFTPSQNTPSLMCLLPCPTPRTAMLQEATDPSCRTSHEATQPSRKHGLSVRVPSGLQDWLHGRRGQDGACCLLWHCCGGHTPSHCLGSVVFEAHRRAWTHAAHAWKPDRHGDVSAATARLYSGWATASRCTLPHHINRTPHTRGHSVSHNRPTLLMLTARKMPSVGSHGGKSLHAASLRAPRPAAASRRQVSEHLRPA